MKVLLCLATGTLSQVSSGPGDITRYRADSPHNSAPSEDDQELIDKEQAILEERRKARQKKLAETLKEEKDANADEKDKDKKDGEKKEGDKKEGEESEEKEEDSSEDDDAFVNGDDE